MEEEAEGEVTRATESEIECPGCGERIKSIAKKCRHCGDFLDPLLKKERRKERRKELGGQRFVVARKVFGVLGAIAFPLLAFGFNEAGFSEELQPEWNDGSLWVWGKLLYAAPPQRWLYPLILASMVAYGFFLKGMRNRWIETGLIGGVIVSGLFSLLFIPAIPAATMGIMMLGVGLLGYTPFIACLTYSIGIWRYRRRGRELAAAPPPGGSIWFPRALWAAFGLAGSGGAYWSLVQLHTALRTTPPPSCYIATAAARGAPRVVPTDPVLFADGSIRPVTRQLRVFKAAELTLRALTPRLHAMLRRAYDRVGRPLAARMGSRQATAAFVLLVPAQLVAELALRVLFRDAGALVDSTYER